MKKAIAKIIVAVILICACVPAVCAHAVTADARSELKYFGKEMLSGNDLYIYELFESNVTNVNDVRSEIKVDREKGITSDRISDVFSIFLGDHPECFYLANQLSFSSIDGAVVSVKNGFYVEGDSMLEMNAALEKAVAEILSAMERDLDAPSEYDKALYLHDAVASVTDYQKEGLHQTAAGALVYGRAVCAGYASAYQLLLNRAGISAFTVTGTSADPNTGIPEPHAWTLMEIDGKCLYADVTWNDQGENIYHAYFGMSREEMEKTHFTDDIYTLPICLHKGETFADKNGFIFNDADGAEVFADSVKKINNTTCKIDLFYMGTDLGTWLGDNILTVYSLLGGRGSLSYSISSMENEYRIEINGDFSGSSLPDTPAVPPPELPTADPELEIPEGDIVFGEDETEAPSQPTEGEDEEEENTEQPSGGTINKPSGGGGGTSANKNTIGCNSGLGAAACIIATLAGFITVIKRRK